MHFRPYYMLRCLFFSIIMSFLLKQHLSYLRTGSPLLFQTCPLKSKHTTRTGHSVAPALSLSLWCLPASSISYPHCSMTIQGLLLPFISKPAFHNHSSPKGTSLSPFSPSYPWDNVHLPEYHRLLL